MATAILPTNADPEEVTTVPLVEDTTPTADHIAQVEHQMSRIGDATERRARRRRKSTTACMIAFILIVVALIGLYLLFAPEGFSQRYLGTVLTLDNKKHHDQMLADNPNRPMVIIYTAPWCNHCKKLESEFKKYSETKGRTDILAAQVRADLDPSFGVAAFPTIRLWHHGLMRDMPCMDRTASGLRECINNMC